MTARTHATETRARKRLDTDDWSALYIGGEWVERGARDVIRDVNPYSGDTWREVPAATEEDVDRAFDAATAAQREHADRTAEELAQPLHEAIALMEENADAIARVLTEEGGGSRTKAMFELERITLLMMREALSFPYRMQGAHARSVVPGKENLVQRVPAGVVAVISPWNFPLHLSMRAVAPALALGNAVVLKPSSDTPVAGGLLLARIFHETSLPKGLLSVLPGSGSTIGNAVSGHSAARVVAFTGSTPVGQKVAANAARALALPAMELGGNAPHVVLEDADLDRAVDAGVFGSFMHQGQICMRINRHLVHRSLYEDYVAKVTDRARSLPWGDPADEDTIVGPVINEKQRDKILGFIRESVNAGATVTTGGHAHGNVIEPTVLRDVTNDMPAAKNETFGPVVPVIPFATDDEAVDLANGTPFGLSASVFSRDVSHARRIADRVHAGMVHINDQPVNDEPHVPFGGMKSSGIGRYNGASILDELTETKWISVQHEPREYPF